MATIAVSEATTRPSLADNTGHRHSNSPPLAVRNRLPDERVSVTHKFEVGGHEGYITVGLYPDHQPGELFITMAKEGSTVSGLISSFAQSISIGLQHGVPLKLFCEKFAHTRFEPSGWSSNPEIRQATSVMDYIFRWLQLKFAHQEKSRIGPEAFPSAGDVPRQPATQIPECRLEDAVPSGDAPSCRHCGSITRRNGSCYVCTNCGSSSGCS